MTVHGYARVSTQAQTVAAQLAALREAGCDRLHSEVAGGSDARPVLESVLELLAQDDVLVVQRLDRLGRSLPDLLRVSRRVERAGAHLRSLAEGWDTRTASGRVIYAVLGALAEYERELLRERTRAALSARREAGLPLGRPRSLTAAEARQAREWLAEGHTTVTSLARRLGVHRSTLYRALAELPDERQTDIAGCDV